MSRLEPLPGLLHLHAFLAASHCITLQIWASGLSPAKVTFLLQRGRQGSWQSAKPVQRACVDRVLMDCRSLLENKNNELKKLPCL